MGSYDGFYFAESGNGTHKLLTAGVGKSVGLAPASRFLHCSSYSITQRLFTDHPVCYSNTKLIKLSASTRKTAQERAGCTTAVASFVNQPRTVYKSSSHLFLRVILSTGYFLAVGTSSFATCYQHGPLTSELSITLFTWTLQLTAFVLIYCGVTIPQVAYAIIAVSLCSKGLCYPLGAACHIARFVCIREHPGPFTTRKH